MFKTILIHLDDVDRCRARLAAAAALDRQRDAFLVGLYPVPSPSLTGYTDAPLPAAIEKMLRDRVLAEAQDNRRWFEEALRGSGCAGVWRSAEGGPADRLLGEAACCADLVVMSQDAEDRQAVLDAALVERVLLRSPAPVLVVPADGRQRDIGRRVLVAWNDSREAARTVGAALPLLGAADKVSVVTVAPDDVATRALRPTELLAYLALHGVRADADGCTGSGGEAGEKLLGRADQLNVDLIVAGGYGHSRLREAVLGGTTRQLLDHAAVPLLLAH